MSFKKYYKKKIDTSVYLQLNMLHFRFDEQISQI